MSITSQLDILNRKLAAAGHTGMIHLADLIAKRGIYANLDLDTRREIFQAIYHFAMHSPIQLSSVIADMAMLNSPEQLAQNLRKQILEHFERLRPALDEYQQVIIYYDNGQEILAKIFKEVESIFPNITIRPNFDHTEKRLFQVSDMLTKLDKMQFDLDHGNAWTKGEIYFLEKSKFREICRQLNTKRIK